ncbi:MAG: helix-turn-helix domain-containing protein, partial [Candidatus Latescibacteria bacterium]|nr:helix-turn-helix domain-containing protein [Candidatus Latescibacterota bacterium]
MVQFGHHLKAARLESGLTQADVASHLGVSKGYISRLESGKARPAEATVRRLAELCATDPDSLLILADYLPSDLREILSQHPAKASAILRGTFGRTDRPQDAPPAVAESQALYQTGEASYQLVQEDCFAWMEHCPPNSVHAIVTDPPYGLKEYTTQEKDKLR